jgi:hypothetical protein
MPNVAKLNSATPNGNRSEPKSLEAAARTLTSVSGCNAEKHERTNAMNNTMDCFEFMQVSFGSFQEAGFLDSDYSDEDFVESAPTLEDLRKERDQELKDLMREATFRIPIKEPKSCPEREPI